MCTPQRFLGVTIKTTSDTALSLREVEERFRHLAENIKEVFWICTVDGTKVHYVSPAYEDVWGRSCQDLYDDPLSWIDAIHEEDRERTAKRFLETVWKGEFDHTYRIIRPDGSIRWIRDRGFPVKDESGDISHITGIAEDITSHKIVESQLRKSEERYRLLYEDFPAMYFTLDPCGTVMSVNRFGADYLGYSKEELLGHPVTMLFHEDDRQAALEHLQNHLSCKDKVSHWTLRKTRKDGSTLWVRETVTTAKNDEGDTIVLVVCDDITEQIKLEEEARASAERLRALAIAFPDIAIILSREGRYLEILTASDELLYADAQQLKGKRIPDVFGKETAALFMNVIKKTLDTREKQTIEYELDVKAGKRIFEGRTAPMYDGGGDPHAILFIARDITQQRVAADKLIEANTFLDSVIENIPNMIFVKDARELRFIRFNKAGESLLGYDRADMIGKNDYDFFPKDEADFFTSKDRAVLANNTLEDVPEENIHTRSGEERILHTKKIPIRNADGEAQYLLGISEDITERKQAEEHRKSLEHKELLLKEIHHRVKNNLQIIYSLLNLQSRQVDDAHTKALFQDIHDRVKSMVLIHEQLYQSADVGKINFTEYLRDLVSHLFRSYTADPNAIQVETGDEPVYFSIDTAVPCGLLVNELVSNALKHAFEGNRPGEMAIDLHPEGDNRYTLSIRDNGVGFPKDLDFKNTTSIGLQLVNTLTQQLGGSIELHPGEGTHFLIEFTADE